MNKFERLKVSQWMLFWKDSCPDCRKRGFYRGNKMTEIFTCEHCGCKWYYYREIILKKKIYKSGEAK